MIFPIIKGLFRYELIDHYAILGVPINAGMDKIRGRYLKIAYRLHPDTCKAKEEMAKQKAGQLLSRIVNPSYEKLSRENSRSEYLIVLAQTSRLITDDHLAEVESKAAKKLLTVDKNLELAYLKILSLLHKHQYDDLDKVYKRIAEISELNLVYLKLSQRENAKPKSTTVSKKQREQPSSASQTSQPTEAASPKTTTSGLDTYLKRAQEALEKENYDRVMYEIRDALKIEPKDSRCHALMGLAYLRKNQLSMAKVHIGTAFKGNPHDPLVRQACSEYNKAAPNNPISSRGSKKDQEEDSKKTGFWNWTKFKK
ncbi:MAG: DnaJ domain-containing protein [Microcystaceae cyanobacterium]